MSTDFDADDAADDFRNDDHSGINAWVTDTFLADIDYEDLNRGQREVLDAVIEATTEWHVDALADLISEAEDEDEVERILAADLNDLGWDHDADIADTQAEIDSLVDDEEDGNED